MRDFLGWTVLLGFGAFCLYMLVAMIRSDINKRKHLARLADNGFTFDHVLAESITSVVFDDTKRRVAFVDGDGISEYAYSDISTWRWEWIEKNGMRIRHCMIIEVLDKKRPLYKLMLSKGTAELWYAKIGAIVRP